MIRRVIEILRDEGPLSLHFRVLAVIQGRPGSCAPPKST
jgi:hypothetical protein